MIYLGLTPAAKVATILAYQAEHALPKRVQFSPEKFRLPLDGESVDWPEIIMYRTFYRLLQEVDANTLLVVNECLRVRNRHDLTYNCLRHILHQGAHVLVFQWLPLLEEIEDFMILFDFATDSRWKREHFDRDLLTETEIYVTERLPRLAPLTIEADAQTHALYAREKARLFADLGLRDPHTIPRNLHLIGGRLRSAHTDLWTWYLARNNRLKLDRVQTYKDPAYPYAPYTLLDFPHNFGDLSDALALSGQTDLPALVTDLPVDQWYLKRYDTWTRRIADGYANLPQG